MKILKNTYLLILVLLFWVSHFSRAGEFETLVEQGRVGLLSPLFASSEETKLPYLVKLLEEAVDMKPCDAQARYYLGTAYGNQNSHRDNTLPKSDVNLTIKASEQFQMVNSLAPKFEGDILWLDPYSKITALWGALALKYSVEGKMDSVTWAMNQGRGRGGYSDFTLELYRNQMGSLPRNALLFTEGDIALFILLYLQSVENCRPDVKIVDNSMLELDWYAKYVSQKMGLEQGCNDHELDTIKMYKKGGGKYVIKIAGGGTRRFVWDSSQRSHVCFDFVPGREFLRLLSANGFRRDVNFTTSQVHFGLRKHLTFNGLSYRLNYDRRPFREADFARSAKDLEQCLKLIDINRRSDVYIANRFLEDILECIFRQHYGNRKRARLLFGMFKECLELAYSKNILDPDNSYNFNDFESLFE